MASLPVQLYTWAAPVVVTPVLSYRWLDLSLLNVIGIANKKTPKLAMLCCNPLNFEQYKKKKLCIWYWRIIWIPAKCKVVFEARRGH